MQPNPTVPPLLAFTNIRLTYPDKSTPTLKDVSLALNAGERIGILGKNGAGKSTLLHIGAGLLTPDAGHVLFHGKVCHTEKEFAQARKHVGYLLQHAENQLFCSTVLEDVAFGPYNCGCSSNEAEQMAWEILTAFDLCHLAGHNGQRLSGGEQKLAALAAVLVMNVRMLFLDEPTNNLDKEARSLLLDILQRFALPALVISHDLSFLRAVCTRFCLLENGLLITDIPLADVGPAINT